MCLLVAVVELRQLRELRRVRRLTTRGLIFRFSRLYPPVEMPLGLIASSRKGRERRKRAGD